VAGVTFELFGAEHAVRYSNDRVCLAILMG
jgi:hypothetical protein